MTISTYTFSFQWVIKKGTSTFWSSCPVAISSFSLRYFDLPTIFQWRDVGHHTEVRKSSKYVKRNLHLHFEVEFHFIITLICGAKWMLTLKKEKLEFAVWCRVLCSECSPIPCCRNAKSKLHQNYVKPLANWIMTTILILCVI